MSFIIILALYPLTSALLSWALKFLKNPMFLDVPTERSNHQTPKPRGAGIILIPLILFSTSVIFLLEDTLITIGKLFLDSVYCFRLFLFWMT